MPDGNNRGEHRTAKSLFIATIVLELARGTADDGGMMAPAPSPAPALPS
jgi:hypothetical protein